MHVAVVGAGPAGLAVVEALLARAGDRLGDRLVVDWLERSPRPDAVLRYGPAPGAAVLRAVASRVDAALGDPRVRFRGGVEVGTDLPWSELERACSHLVVATGSARDLPLRVPGADAVGVTTVSYLRACAAGSPDSFGPAIDPRVDSAAVLEPTALRTKELLAAVPRVEHLAGVDPVALVGRNRVRAVRVAERVDGRLRVRDVRAQLVLCAYDPRRRPDIGAGCEVVGWAGRDPAKGGSHAEDAAAAVTAILNCADSRAAHRGEPPEWGSTPLSAQFSAVAEVEALLERFAGEGTLPLADYDALLADADDD